MASHFKVPEFVAPIRFTSRRTNALSIRSTSVIGRCPAARTAIGEMGGHPVAFQSCVQAQQKSRANK
jgi:hypothetical protein